MTTREKIKPLDIKQRKKLIEILRDETELTGNDIVRLIKIFKQEGLLKEIKWK